MQKVKVVDVLKIINKPYYKDNTWCLDIIWGKDGSTNKGVVKSEDKKELEDISQGDAVSLER